MKLRCHDQLDKVPSMMKIKQDNNVTNYIGLVYAKIEIKLSGPI